MKIIFKICSQKSGIAIYSRQSPYLSSHQILQQLCKYISTPVVVNKRQLCILLNGVRAALRKIG